MVKITKQEASRRYEEYIRRQAVNGVVAKSMDDWLVAYGLMVIATSDTSSDTSSSSSYDYSSDSSSSSCGGVIESL